MTNKFIVEYRYYAFDDGHHHWTDDYESFATESDALTFIAELDERIANGDHNVRSGRIVSESDLFSYARSYGKPRKRTPGPLF